MPPQNRAPLSIPAIEIRQTGGPDVLLPVDRPAPGAPGPGRILVELARAGVNFVDIYRREGRYPPALPAVPLTGLARLSREVVDRTEHDAVLVLATHWATTTETVITAHAQRSGRFTSDEMPGEVSRIPYALPGDPELAHAVAAAAGKDALRLSANDDPHLPIHYATLNLWTYLGRPGVPWLSMSVCRTAITEDHLRLGAAVAEAVDGLARRVLVLASGGLSHRFWPLAELRARMAGDPANIVTPAARAADEQRIAWLEAGRHDRVIATMPEYRPHAPEGDFGHYLMLAGALGGSRCTVPARRYSAYESAIGTGQVHLWFDHPAAGRTH